MNTSEINNEGTNVVSDNQVINNVAELFASNPVELILMATGQIQPFIIRQSKQIIDLQSENESLRISNAENTTVLKVENQDLNKKLDSANKELTDNKDEILKLVESNTRFEIKNQDLNKKLDSANKELSDKNVLLNELSVSLESEKSSKEALEKQLEDSKKKNVEQDQVIKGKNEIIKELSIAKEDCQKQITNQILGRNAVLISVVKHLNLSVGQCIQQVDGKWCDYFKPMTVEIPDDKEKLPEVVKRMIVAENSVLCKLASIRWWSMQPELYQKMKDKFDVDLLVCLTDILVDLVGQYGFELTMPKGPFYTNLSSTGYEAYQGAFSIVKELFPNCESVKEKSLYCEVSKLSYTYDGNSIVGGIAYTN